MFNGYKTYIAAGVVVVMSIARVAGIDIGLDQEQFVDAVMALIGVALAFLRRGVSNP